MAMADADWLPITLAVGPGAVFPDKPSAEKSPPKSAASLFNTQKLCGHGTYSLVPNVTHVWLLWHMWFNKPM